MFACPDQRPENSSAASRRPREADTKAQAPGPLLGNCTPAVLVGPLGAELSSRHPTSKREDDKTQLYEVLYSCIWSFLPLLRAC